MLVERLAGDPGLDDTIQILRVHGEDSVHVAQVDRNPAERRIDVSLERRAGSERNDRDRVLGADTNDALHVFGGLSKYHRIRRLVVVPCRGVTVLFAHGLRRDEPIAKQRRKLGDRAFDGLRLGLFKHDLYLFRPPTPAQRRRPPARPPKRSPPSARSPRSARSPPKRSSSKAPRRSESSTRRSPVSRLERSRSRSSVVR